MKIAIDRGDLAATLRRTYGIIAAVLTTAHTCRLGKWHGAVSNSTLRAKPAFNAIIDPHRLVHGQDRLAL